MISFFATVGNYNYDCGFYWYLSLDGTIECEVKLTGILFTSAYPGVANPTAIKADAAGADYPYASEVAPGLGAPYHQHLYSARLDMMVDGVSNAVDEVDAQRLPMGPGNEHGNTFTKKSTRLSTELESGRLADASGARAWHIVNTEKTSRMGRPTGYVLLPEANPTLMADPASGIAKRAEFATKHLFVTQYDPAERYAAGDFMHQNPGGDGVTWYMAGDGSIDGEDIVLWHPFGPTHFPRVEDWPVTPVDYAKFAPKPYGFFGRNPAMNIPANEPTAHCSYGGAVHADAAGAALASGAAPAAGHCAC